MGHSQGRTNKWLPSCESRPYPSFNLIKNLVYLFFKYGNHACLVYLVINPLSFYTSVGDLNGSGNHIILRRGGDENGSFHIHSALLAGEFWWIWIKKSSSVGDQFITIPHIWQVVYTDLDLVTISFCPKKGRWLKRNWIRNPLISGSLSIVILHLCRWLIWIRIQKTPPFSHLRIR